MMTEVLIAKAATFTKAGRYVERGQPISADEIDFDAEKSKDHVIPAPDGVDGTAVVEISAIAPTGPNPQNPQQLPPDGYQTQSGYGQAGAKLVGEVTVPEKQRIEIVGIDKDDDTQAKVTEALDNADNGNKPNEGTEGTVADVSARAAELDAAGLDELEARENDREKPRKGVLDAIAARRTALEDEAQA
jgi:hypothetical protein